MLVLAVDVPCCINCFAAGLTHNHMATGRDCPFFLEHNNCSNITNLLNLIRDRHMEGHDNPFGATRVCSISGDHGSCASSSATHPVPQCPPACIDDYYPCRPLFNPSLTPSHLAPYGLASQILPASDSLSSMKLASSGDSAMAPPS